MLISDRIWLPYYAPDDMSGGSNEPVGDTVSETSPEEEATVSSPPSDDDTSDDLSNIVAEVAGEIGDDDSDGTYNRDENGRFAKQDDNESIEDDAAERSEDQQADDVQAELPEHMAGWSDQELAAFDLLPEDAQNFLSNPEGVVEYVEDHVRQQYEPLVQQLEPLMQVMQDPQTSDYLERRSHELNVAPHDIISSVLQTDAFLTYSTDTNARHQAAMQLLQNYGIDPVDMVLGPEGGQDYRQHDMQQQLAQERWQRQRMEQQVQHQYGVQMSQNVEAFASQAGADGQPLRPMMSNPSVRASMGNLISSGQAHSLDQAYQMVAGPIEAEIAQRSQQLAAQQSAQAAQSRQKAVRRSARAAPVRTNTAMSGGKRDGQSIEDIVTDVVSEIM